MIYFCFIYFQCANVDKFAHIQAEKVLKNCKKPSESRQKPESGAFALDFNK